MPLLTARGSRRRACDEIARPAPVRGQSFRHPESFPWLPTRARSRVPWRGTGERPSAARSLPPLQCLPARPWRRSPGAAPARSRARSGAGCADVRGPPSPTLRARAVLLTPSSAATSRSMIRAPGVSRAVTIARRRVSRTLSPSRLTFRCAIWYTYYSETIPGTQGRLGEDSVTRARRPSVSGF